MSHLLYMNDLKRSEKEVWSEKVWNSSHAKGKVLAGPDNPERSEESIRSLEKVTTYKYLGTRTTV